MVSFIRFTFATKNYSLNINSAFLQTSVRSGVFCWMSNPPVTSTSKKKNKASGSYIISVYVSCYSVLFMQLEL